MIAFITTSKAQKNKKSSNPTTGYAITAVNKGGRSWKEVRLIDFTTGSIVKSIYESKQEVEALNARTGKAVIKKDIPTAKTITLLPSSQLIQKKVINLDEELNKTIADNAKAQLNKVIIRQSVDVNKPFSTNSAAIAYDKKHERLYYTPMGINQLRYIDLKTGKVYYFEDEAFGIVKSFGDASNQITRMVIASDGNGYALTNDANHLLRFTTDKKAAITDLGAVTDDASNTKSIHNPSGFGGDMIADASGNLYLLTANRNVFKINIESRVAVFQGAIKGLPQGFTTNGAMVEGGSKVIIASSESTVGYYRFDLTTMQAEKVSSSPDVFNASDLANGNLAFDKKKKNKSEEVKTETKPIVADPITKSQTIQETIAKNRIAVYPNPVTNGVVNLSFSDLAAGRYKVELLDISGNLISSKQVNIQNEKQIEEFRFPGLSVSGNYLIRVTDKKNKVNVTNKIVVQ
jgi:hypothetical protein